MGKWPITVTRRRLAPTRACITRAIVATLHTQITGLGSCEVGEDAFQAQADTPHAHAHASADGLASVYQQIGRSFSAWARSPSL